MLEKIKTKTLKNALSGLVDGLTPSIKNSISKDENGKIVINKVRVSVSVLSWMLLVAQAMHLIPQEAIEILKNIILNYVKN